jgi:hypothetical protein
MDNLYLKRQGKKLISLSNSIDSNLGPYILKQLPLIGAAYLTIEDRMKARVKKSKQDIGKAKFKFSIPYRCPYCEQEHDNNQLNVCVNCNPK